MVPGPLRVFGVKVMLPGGGGEHLRGGAKQRRKRRRASKRHGITRGGGGEARGWFSVRHTREILHFAAFQESRSTRMVIPVLKSALGRSKLLAFSDVSSDWHGSGPLVAHTLSARVSSL